MSVAGTQGAPHAAADGPARVPALAIVLRAEVDGPKLACEPVTATDLGEVFAEAWLEGCLRKGRAEVPFAEADLRLVPAQDGEAAARYAGFAVEVTPPGGAMARREFPIRSLSHVARRAARPLLASGALKAGAEYYFELVRDRAREAVAGSGEPPGTHVKRAPLTYLSVPLRPLLQDSTALNVVDEEALPLFYTAEAFAKAERCARRGAKAQPPVETGGVLLGALASCPDSGEFFGVVTDVLEVQEAEEKEFALTYSSQSWTRLQAIIRARQAAHPERAERLLGQAHGHNFLPLDGQICAECLKRPECSTHNTHASLADEEWTRAVFVRQPWAMNHIFGLTARGDPRHQLHGFREGRLQPRGFFLLPDFRPEQWELKTAKPAAVF